MLDIFTTVYEKTNYKDRATCPPRTGIIAGATGGVLAFVAVVCACVYIRKKNSKSGELEKEDTFVRRTERSNTVEESPPPAPMASTGEAGVLQVLQAFIDFEEKKKKELEEKKKKELKTRLENVK